MYISACLVWSSEASKQLVWLLSLLGTSVFTFGGISALRVCKIAFLSCSVNSYRRHLVVYVAVD